MSMSHVPCLLCRLVPVIVLACGEVFFDLQGALDNPGPGDINCLHMLPAGVGYSSYICSIACLVQT